MFAGWLGIWLRSCSTCPGYSRRNLLKTPPVSVLDYYAGARWIGAGVDEEINVRLRRTSEEAASGGAEALAAEVEAVLADLRVALPAAPPDRLVTFSAKPLRLDDFLLTRMMEIAVHSDDLALSVGIPTPPLPPAVFDPVLDLLSRLAVGRHGHVAVLRALSRAERAPTTIAAI